MCDKRGGETHALVITAQQLCCERDLQSTTELARKEGRKSDLTTTGKSMGVDLPVEEAVVGSSYVMVCQRVVRELRRFRRTCRGDHALMTHE